jgi:hypothetical protein
MLARAAQDGGRLTNRQRVIFQLREARALAQLGDGTGAVRLAEAAASAFEDGATREDPEWSWWVDTSEVMGHVAWTLVESGRPRRAAPILQRSVEACPAAHANNHLFRLARYLGATVDAEAWSDAEDVARRVLPQAAEVRSGRAVRLLMRSIRRMEAEAAPGRPSEAAHDLREVLTDAGYDPV